MDDYSIRQIIQFNFLMKPLKCRRIDRNKWMLFISIQRFNGNNNLSNRLTGVCGFCSSLQGVERLVSAGTRRMRSLHNDVWESQFVGGGGQMEHYKHANLHRVHLEDRLGLKHSGRTSQITSDWDELTHDGGIHQSRAVTQARGAPTFPRSSPLPHSAAS